MAQTKITDKSLADNAIQQRHISDGSLLDRHVSSGFTPTVISNKTNSSTGYFHPPVGTTAQRITTPNAGMRFNTTLGYHEWFDAANNLWLRVGDVVPAIATGGTVTEINVNGVAYRVHAFYPIGNHTLNVTRAGEVEYLLVGGGGGGGTDMGGGGGGGGVISGKIYLSAQNYSLFVARGGYGAPAGGTVSVAFPGITQPGASNPKTVPSTNGQNTTFSGIGVSLTAIGGGGGGTGTGSATAPRAGYNGGSGGGCSGYGDGDVRGGAGTLGQGHDGGNARSNYYSGGGGGAGAPGIGSPERPHGGHGIVSDILGTPYFFGGGGGGSGYTICGGHGGMGGGGGGAICVGYGGRGGINNGQDGGGGAGSAQSNRPGGDGGNNTGGGGGGGSHYFANNKGGEGGSGIIVIRYRI